MLEGGPWVRDRRDGRGSMFWVMRKGFHPIYCDLVVLYPLCIVNALQYDGNPRLFIDCFHSLRLLK